MIIRRTTPDDDGTLLRLAALDDTCPLTGEALVAEVDGEALAAISLTDGRAIANPFEHTAALVDLLKLRATQLAKQRAPRSGTKRHLLTRRATAGA